MSLQSFNTHSLFCSVMRLRARFEPNAPWFICVNVWNGDQWKKEGRQVWARTVDSTGRTTIELTVEWMDWCVEGREKKSFFLRCANDLNINARKRSSSSILWGVSSTKSLFSCLRDFALLLPRNRQVERKTQLWISSFNSRAKYTESIITPIMNGGAEK